MPSDTSRARALIEKLANADIDISGTAAIGITSADIIAARDWLDTYAVADIHTHTPIQRDSAMTKLEAEALSLAMTAGASAGVSYYPSRDTTGRWVVMGTDFGEEGPWVVEDVEATSTGTADIRRLTPTDTDTAIPAGEEMTEVQRIVRWIDQAIERAKRHGNTEGIWLFGSQWRTVRAILAASPKPDTDTPVDPGMEGVREARRLARTAFALEVSQIDRDALLTGLTDDEIDSIIDGVLSAAALAAKPIAGMDAGEVAWREGWSDAKACLTDDEAFCLTVDVEEDAWRDSATSAAATTQEDGRPSIPPRP